MDRAALCLVATTAFFSAAAAQSPSDGPVDFLNADRSPIRSTWLERVDFSRLQEQASQRRPELTRAELDRLVRANFEFLFFNHVRNEKFVVDPKPEWVVEKLVELLELRSDLELVLEQGKDLSSESDPEQRKSVVREFRRCSKRLGGHFNRYFSEVSGGEVKVYSPDVGSSHLQYRYFLLQAERLVSVLTRRLDGFFLSPLPGVADVTSYSGSVKVLTRSMSQLADRTLPFMKKR